MLASLSCFWTHVSSDCNCSVIDGAFSFNGRSCLGEVSPCLITRFQRFWPLQITCTELTPWSRVLSEKLTRPKVLRNSPHFMQPEGSLPHSQEPATTSRPEPDWSSPCPTPSILSLSTPGFSKWSPSLGFHHQNPVCTSPLPYTCYVSCPSQSSWLDLPDDIW